MIISLTLLWALKILLTSVINFCNVKSNDLIVLNSKISNIAILLKPSIKR